MVHRLLDAAWRVCVLSRSLGADDEILRAGAEIRASPGEAAADARVVCLTLPDDASVRRVCEPLIPTLDAGQAIVDFGKTSPPLTQEMGKATSARGASFVYAPDSVWPQGARAGTLSIMVGATRAVARELVDLFAVLGSPTWFGATGKGQIAKLCNQIVVGYAIAAITEAMLLGEAHEVSLQLLPQAFRTGAADSWPLLNKGEKMLANQREAEGRAATHLKDHDHAWDAALEVGLQLPLTRDVRAWFQALVSAGMGNLDHSSLRLEQPRDSEVGESRV